MARKTDKYAGWRPRYKGLIDNGGYGLEYKSYDSLLDIEYYLDETKEYVNAYCRDGLNFIVPKSKDWKEIAIDGSNDQAVYLDFLNLNCGHKQRNLERFLDLYGTPVPDPDWIGWRGRPSPGRELWCTVEGIFGTVDRYREYVGDLVDVTPTDSLLECPQDAWHQVSLDLATGELVVDAKYLYDFIFLQIADVFSRGLRIKNCDHCGGYMTPSRNTRAYCGDTCRKRAQRA
jgi:hypothetical protein